MTNKLNKRAMEHLIRRGLEEGVITPAQVNYSERNPGTFIGAKGFVGRCCKYCCGPDKPRGNIALPLDEMYDKDTCKICHEMIEACGIGD